MRNITVTIPDDAYRRGWPCPLRQLAKPELNFAFFACETVETHLIHAESMGTQDNCTGTQKL